MDTCSPGWLRSAVLVVAVTCSPWALASCGGEDGGGEQAGGGGSPGAEIYERSCASCHGSDLRGTDRGPSHLSQVYAPDHHPDESFRAAITHGSSAHHWPFGPMPAIAGLDDAEIDAVIAYVRQQQEEHGLEPYPPGAGG